MRRFKSFLATRVRPLILTNSVVIAIALGWAIYTFATAEHPVGVYISANRIHALLSLACILQAAIAISCVDAQSQLAATGRRVVLTATLLFIVYVGWSMLLIRSNTISVSSRVAYGNLLSVFLWFPILLSNGIALLESTYRMGKEVGSH